MNLRRQVRGAVGIMGIWAAVFGLAGVALLIPLYALGAFPRFEFSGFVRTVVNVFVRWAFGGAGMGLAFAAAVALGERGQAFVALSPRRFVAWGFGAGAIVPTGMATIYVLTGHSSIAINLRTGLIFAGICGALGASLAAMTLRAALGAPVAFDETPQVAVRVI
ncbi:MAG: hypothetical protein ABI442_03100 [Gemmatimonadaceae bacterium]